MGIDENFVFGGFFENVEVKFDDLLFVTCKKIQFQPLNAAISNFLKFSDTLIRFIKSIPWPGIAKGGSCNDGFNIFFIIIPQQVFDLAKIFGFREKFTSNDWTNFCQHFFWNTTISQRIHSIGVNDKAIGHFIVRPAGIIPDKEFHILHFGVIGQLIDIAIDHNVPVSIHQRILPVHFRSQIHMVFQRNVIGTGGGIRPPTPGRAAGFDPVCILIFRGTAEMIDNIGFH